MLLNQVYHLDCLLGLKHLPDKCADLIILDPPYNVGAADWDRIDSYFSWMKCVLDESFRLLKPNGSLYLWGMSKNNDFLKLKLWMDDSIKTHEFKNWIVWVHDVKIHRRQSDKYLTKHEDLLFYAGKNNTFNIQRDAPTEFQLKTHAGRYDKNFFIERKKLPPSQQKIFKHGLQLGSPAKSWWKGPANQSAAKQIKKFAGYKSEWVCERIINTSSNPNDLIIVPFCGTGTEVVCAKRLNRNYIAFEINKERFNLSCERVQSTVANVI